MLIQCTKKLLDELNIKPASHPDEEPLFSWHANLVRVNRRKTVVLVNDRNRYVIVLYGLKAKDFKKLDEHIIQAIRETFQNECIKDEIIEQFINHSKEVTYTKTKDRTSVARMNKSCELVYGYEDLMLEGYINQSAVNIRVSRLIVGDGSKKYVRPSEELYKDLEAFADKPIFACKAVELKVTLDLEKYNVWRRIVVPVNITFNKLHKVLQAAFGWKDYHLHEFYIYDNEKFDNELSINHSGYHKEGYKPIINLVYDEEALGYENDVPMKLETGIKLSEYIPARIKYNYDFGDNWQHYIEVERVIDDYDKNYPVCLEGEGNTPPEDVGGEHGYEEFLEIIADEKHPEHEEMVAWGESQGYNDFDIEMVNRAMKFEYRM
ncbi:plasmid pRiA4b ORF-3 family protein [Desulfotruncus alcoholivorax]|uniref:plasmid pRiA4b ORF-3 family protein n=1 Tax=Desulfotruncus alcoholivorax TaxID=265477 RepID=UPI0004813FF2|nr:plasmid pRiA4b ORF-3 family protein [Desulfotruncus alcoholivorax]